MFFFHDLFEIFKDDECEIQLKTIDIKNFELILQCIKNESFQKTLSRNQIITVIQIADFLNARKLLHQIAINAVTPKIEGNSINIRSIWSINPVNIIDDDEDWDYDPIAGLDPMNFIFDYFSIQTVHEMMKLLDTFLLRSNFIHSFGKNHRFFKSLKKSFNTLLNNQLQ